MSPAMRDFTSDLNTLRCSTSRSEKDTTENIELEAILKIVDYVQGQGENRFKSGAYTVVFEHFESVCNTALGR